MSQAMTSQPGSGEASLYVHVPFCCGKCRYCAFYSVIAPESAFDDFLRAIAIEWELTREEEPRLQDPAARIASVYIGGGTPSILGGERLARLLEVLRLGPAWSEDCEVSIEVNPESVSRSLADRVLAAGCNRISVGVQSFRDEELAVLGRAARAQDAHRAIAEIRAAGCRNLNIDLIYGVPGQSLDAWSETLGRALEHHSQHLSCYLLTPEENTVLHRLLHGGQLHTPLEELVLLQYKALREAAAGAGLEQYEISNFAEPGHRCRHNEGTWARSPYYGLGPAAHSFDGEVRWQNAADVGGYLRQVLDGRQRPGRERYRLDRLDVAKELIILGLRRSGGVAWDQLAASMTPAELGRVRRRVSFLAATGFLVQDVAGVRLSPSAYFVSNAIFVELLRALEEEAA